MLTEAIRHRRRYSAKRLTALRKTLDGAPEARSLQDLCIYVTGSFGRLEASRVSDLDVFFVHAGSKQKPVSNISKILLDALLIRTCRLMHFPEFSADGKYLEIHYIDDLHSSLGSPDDDFYNFFTARLLLLLESQPLWNEAAYEGYLRQILAWYFRDFEDHAGQFKPRFLLNDIMRYWRTLCLNYEQRREGSPRDRVVNFKLKFSRMLTCFSAVIAIASLRPPISERKVLDVIRRTPLERLVSVATVASDSGRLVKRVIDEYDWFLEQTSSGNSRTQQWLSRQPAREEAFERAGRFGHSVYELLAVTTDAETMRYLVI